MGIMGPEDVFIVVDVWGTDGYYAHPAPVVAKTAEVFEAVDREGIREVVLFKSSQGELVGVFVPERDEIVSLSVFGSKGNDEPRRVIPAPPPGKRILWVEIHEGGIRVKDGPLPLPPYLRDRRLYAKFISPEGEEESGLHVAPAGTIAIMLGRAVRILHNDEMVIPIPPEIKRVDSEVDAEKGIAYIDLYNHEDKLVHRFQYKLGEGEDFGYSVVPAVLGVDLKRSLFVVAPVPDGYDVRLGVAKVSQVEGDGLRFEDDTPAPPEGKRWVKIVITPEGINLAAD